MAGFEMKTYNSKIAEALKAGNQESWIRLVDDRFSNNSMAIKVDAVVEAHHAMQAARTPGFKVSAGKKALEMEHSLTTTRTGSMIVVNLYARNAAGQTNLDRLIASKVLASGRAVSAHHPIGVATARGLIPGARLPRGRQPIV